MHETKTFFCLPVYESQKKTKKCFFLKFFSTKNVRFVDFSKFVIQIFIESMSSPMEKNVRFFFPKKPYFFISSCRSVKIRKCESFKNVLVWKLFLDLDDLMYWGDIYKKFESYVRLKSVHCANPPPSIFLNMTFSKKLCLQSFRYTSEWKI